MTTPALTALESLLAQPDAEEHRQQRLQRLDELAWQFRTRLQAGVSKQDFPQVQALVEAIAAAHHVLTCWPTRSSNESPLLGRSTVV